LLVAWQRLFNLPAVSTAVENAGMLKIITDHGVWPHSESVIFDTTGENAESDIAGGMDRLLAMPGERAAVDNAAYLFDDIRRYLEQKATEADLQLDALGLSDIPTRFAVLTLQRRDKVLRLDAEKQYREQWQVAKQAIQAAKNTGSYVVIKPHPDGDILPRPHAGPNFRILPVISDKETNSLTLTWLLKKATHMITVNSTTWQLAAIMDTPVAALGRGWYSGNNVIHEATNMMDAIRPPYMDRSRATDLVCLMLSRQLPAEKISDPALFGAMADRLHGGKITHWEST